MSHRTAKRSVTIGGHRTSYSVEQPFQDGLEALARAMAIPVARLVAAIDADRPPDINLSSAIRVHVLAAARAGLLPVN